MTITTPTDLAAALDQARAETILARSLATELDAALAAVHARFDHKIKSHQDNVKALSKAIQAYAVTHRRTLLPDPKVKSTHISGHELGWRDNGGAVTVRKGLSEKKVIARLLAAGGRLRALFIRQTPALNKDAIRAKWPAFSAKLQPLGLRFEHSEDFFINLDITEPADSTLKQAA